MALVLKLSAYTCVRNRFFGIHLRPILLMMLLCLATSLAAQNPDKPVAQAFELVNRTSYEIQQSQGIRVQMDVPGLEWRVFATANPVDFEHILEAAEGGDPFDLVFPLATASVTAPSHISPPYPGLLSDRFHPLSLPGPGLEAQIGYDGIWSVVERTPSSPGKEMQFAFSSKGLRISQWNTLSTATSPSNPAVWTTDFAPVLRFPSMDQPYSPSAWVALEWIFENPWLNTASPVPDLPILSWRNRPVRIVRVSPDPLSLGGDNGDALLRVPDSYKEFSASLRAGQPIIASFLNVPNADRCPIIVGGILPIIRQGEWIGPKPQRSLKSADLPFRQDLASCFSVNGSPYTWIGISQTANEVWFGRSGSGQSRQGTMPPPVLADQLAPFALDYAGICSTSRDTIAIRWLNEWIGSRDGSSPGNVTAALCLRLHPVRDKPHWANALRDPQISITATNTPDSGKFVDALRDGRAHAGAILTSFWWASPKDPEQPVVLEFDLRYPRPIYWVEMLHAAKSGFSVHFNLRDYQWQFRSSASTEWTDAVQTTQNALSVTRHIFSQPIQARWWRLVIPPPSNPSEMPIIHRLAEVEFWTQGQSANQN